MEVQAAISRERLAAKVGRTLQVLVDEVEGTTAIARSAADAPEIDGLVRVKGARGARPGEFLQARITAAGEHDLEAVRSA
jgi:ribosomal protein S12 methylthiotransferase